MGGLLFGALISAFPSVAVASVMLHPYAGPAPDFTLDRLVAEQAPAQPLRLSDLAGRVVLVHFFATWCASCREELPALARFAARFAGRAIIVAVDVGEVDARVRRFLTDAPVPFPVLMDRDHAVTKAWDIDALPSTVVLGADLEPRLMAEGDVEWDRREAKDAIEAIIATTGGPLQ